MNRRNAATAIVVVALAALAAVLALYATRTETPSASPSPTVGAQTASPLPTLTSPLPTPTPAPRTATPSPTVLPGAITGRFGYGSDFIPPVTVYAISTTDTRVWYSVNFPGLGNPPRPTAPPGTPGDTYTITGVAPGTYWIVAYRNDGQLPDPGYYSRQPECFRARPSGPCPDVALVPATVLAGQTTNGIDVVTWGPPPPGQPSPPFPPRPTPR